jgi:hypothetical protein
MGKLTPDGRPGDRRINKSESLLQKSEKRSRCHFDHREKSFDKWPTLARGSDMRNLDKREKPEKREKREKP